MLHMLQWINIVDNVTKTTQKPVVWTRGLHLSVWKTSWWVCSLHHVKEPLWFWDLQKRTALFKFSKILASSFITILLEIVPDRNRGWRCSLKNLLLNSCWTWTALCVSANLRTIKALWRGVNCTPTMMSSKLINEDPCSNHGLLDSIGNIINNVYSLKHVKHDKNELTLSTMFIHWSMWSMTRMSSLGTIVHNK